MLLNDWKEQFGLATLKDYEVAKKLKDAREKNLDEVEFVLPDGKTVKIRLSYSNPEGVFGPGSLGW